MDGRSDTGTPPLILCGLFGITNPSTFSFMLRSDMTVNETVQATTANPLKFSQAMKSLYKNTLTKMYVFLFVRISVYLGHIFYSR